ncbi:Uncharacterised protein [Salmonella enterica subsp. enterica serovar Typhi]|nr:Uncharacterised protein [Salmonella enterica subsp. enterica serovar Typhi]
MGHAQLSSMVWRLRGLNVTVHDQLPSMVWRHGLAIKGAQCHGTLPTFYHGQSIQVVKFRY